MHFLEVFACVPLLVFSLDFVHPPSFLVGLFVFFTLVASSLACVRHINFIAFSFDYIMLFQTHYSNLVHSFSEYYSPRFNIYIFLIIAFVYCDIVERVSCSQIVKYLLKSL